MKIVDVAEFYADLGGGVKTYINQKLEAGKKAGHDVVIIAPGDDDRKEERLGGKVIWVKGPKLFLDPRYYVLYREKAVHAVLDEEKPDVLEGSSPWTGGWFAARWKGDAVRTFIFHQDPVAVFPETFFGHIVGKRNVNRVFFWYWVFLRTLSNRYDATVVSGKWLAEKLVDFNIKRPIAVPFGINKEQFSPNKKSDEIKNALLKKCGVSEDGKLIITISRYHPEKRLPLLLKAFGEISKKHPDVGYVIFGDGPLRKKIKKIAQNIPHVHLTGYVTDRDYIAQVMASADMMLHGSSAETFGLVMAEALCSGLPLVVPDSGGAYDLAGNDYGEIYRTGKLDSCIAAIENMFRRDTEEMRKAAVKKGKNGVWTMDDHFKSLFENYQKLVEEKISP